MCVCVCILQCLIRSTPINSHDVAFLQDANLKAFLLFVADIHTYICGGVLYEYCSVFRGRTYQHLLSSTPTDSRWNLL